MPACWMILIYIFFIFNKITAKIFSFKKIKEKARGEEPSQVKVHASDGNIQYESTLGNIRVGHFNFLLDSPL